MVLFACFFDWVLFGLWWFLFVWFGSVLCFLLLSLQQLCSPQNVNCRDLEGRHSTPLHFAAGYNRVSVVEYLLHHGADVHAKDKGYISFHYILRCLLLV